VLLWSALELKRPDDMVGTSLIHPQSCISTRVVLAEKCRAVPSCRSAQNGVFLNRVKESFRISVSTSFSAESKQLGVKGAVRWRNTALSCDWISLGMLIVRVLSGPTKTSKIAWA